MTDAEMERIKYFATLLNTCAAACFTIGVVGPGAAAAYGTPPHVAVGLFVLVAVGWLLVAFSLHLAVTGASGAMKQANEAGMLDTKAMRIFLTALSAFFIICMLVCILLTGIPAR